MNIVEFYTKLSKLVELASNNHIDKRLAKEKLKDLMEKAKSNNLHVKVPKNILSKKYLNLLNEDSL